MGKVYTIALIDLISIRYPEVVRTNYTMLVLAFSTTFKVIRWSKHFERLLKLSPRRNQIISSNSQNKKDKNQV